MRTDDLVIGDGAVAVEPATSIESEFIRVLGSAVVAHAGERRFVRRITPAEPIANDAELRALCVAHPEITLVYRFQLTWPGARTPLPHQEGEHYADGEPLASWLVLYVAGKYIDLSLRFPFESFSEPTFAAVYDAICSTLGRVMTPTRFQRLAASADGKRMVQRLARFERTALDQA